MLQKSSRRRAGNHTRLTVCFRLIQSTAIQLRARSVVSAMIPCEITQYKHHAMRTSFSMWVK